MQIAFTFSLLFTDLLYQEDDVERGIVSVDLNNVEQLGI